MAIADELRAYVAGNPGLMIRDVFKYLYQSAFGCEHLVTDYERSLGWIRREAETAGEDLLPETEALSGDFARVHLSVLSGGLAPETLTRLFMLSAEKREDGPARLAEGLEAFGRLAEAGELPFPAADIRDAVAAWEAQGFEPVHHSEEFRNALRPAYRVVKKSFIPLLPLLTALDKRRAQAGERPFLVGIDGPCASGKTTLAAVLGEIYGAPVFHMDDYFLRPEQRTPERFASPGANADHERFEEEILRPLSHGAAVTFRRFDCGEQRLMPPVTVPIRPVNICEGSYTLHPMHRPRYDFAVFLKIAPKEQRRRILARNPDTAENFFTRWIPLEEAYFSAFPVEASADFVQE